MVAKRVIYYADEYKQLEDAYLSLQNDYLSLQSKLKKEINKNKQLQKHNKYLFKLCVKLQDDLLILAKSIDLKVQDSVEVQDYIRKIKPKSGTSKAVKQGKINSKSLQNYLRYYEDLY